MGISRDDPNKTITRLLLNRAQFSRVIGKGGENHVILKSRVRISYQLTIFYL